VSTQLLTMQETYDRLRRGHSSTYKLISDGLLETVKIGGRRFVTEDAIERLIENGKELNDGKGNE
jgi:hypothetical protein